MESVDVDLVFQPMPLPASLTFNVAAILRGRPTLTGKFADRAGGLRIVRKFAGLPKCLPKRARCLPRKQTSAAVETLEPTGPPAEPPRPCMADRGDSTRACLWKTSGCAGVYRPEATHSHN